jgi:hypothetical protein
VTFNRERYLHAVIAIMLEDRFKRDTPEAAHDAIRNVAQHALTAADNDVVRAIGYLTTAIDEVVETLNKEN